MTFKMLDITNRPSGKKFRLCSRLFCILYNKVLLEVTLHIDSRQRFLSEHMYFCYYTGLQNLLWNCKLHTAKLPIAMFKRSRVVPGLYTRPIVPSFFSYFWRKKSLFLFDFSFCLTFFSWFLFGILNFLFLFWMNEWKYQLSDVVWQQRHYLLDYKLTALTPSST